MSEQAREASVRTLKLGDPNPSRKIERLARITILLLVLAALAIPLGGRWLAGNTAAVALRATMPEVGGWTPDVLNAQVGEPLELRLTSDDVVHGFAVGRHDSAEIEVMPGRWSSASLIFDEPGTYTFYCTRWCGPDHWRMRGTIEVAGGETAPDGEVPVPRYVTFGIDPDMPMRAEVVPATTPVATRGARWSERLPSYALESATYWGNSPAELWMQLRQEPALVDLSDMDLWDAVAWIWAQQTAPAARAEAAEIYRREGAAAHGETGQGDGVMVQDLPPYDYNFMHNGHESIRPPDFSDPYHTLGASPARLEGKMLRGGMGTGMPSYGEIYTPEQIEALVAFTYTFVMDLGEGVTGSQPTGGGDE